jgi:hypothetical protein
MNAVSAISATSYIPQMTAPDPASAGTASAPPLETNLIALSGADTSAGDPNVYTAPDRAFASLLQSDPSLAQDYAAESQFGFSDPVIAMDDTLSMSSDRSAASTMSMSVPNAMTVAEQTALGSLDFTSGVGGALFGSVSDASSALFMGAGMATLLNANGSSALAYLTPQAAAAAGAHIDMSA